MKRWSIEWQEYGTATMGSPAVGWETVEADTLAAAKQNYESRFPFRRVTAINLHCMNSRGGETRITRFIVKKAAVKLNPTATKVLKFLAEEWREDFGCYGFKGIMAGTRIEDRAAVRRACRLLARKGLAEFHSPLWTEDGEPAGAGYCASRAGIDAALNRK